VTNRELYLGARALKPADERMLADVLRGFRAALSRHYGAAGGVTPDELLAPLVAGFTGEVLPREALGRQRT
jgi:hypothetical protein